ncbi:MAG: PAS domain S-box protein, partial [Candidatus Saliniplasma sp.]
MEEIKILFVDDEPGILDQAKIFLEREDERFDIITSNSASQALKLLDEQGFDVIVSDYQMPDIDGLEFLEEIRNVRGDDIPFIMFTGRGREEVAMRTLNLGADRYMQKGGDPKSQYGVLAQAIAQESRHYRTETSLKKKNELLTQIFERSEEGFYIRDISGKLTFVNESFADIHGYSQDELIDKESRSFLTDESKKQVEKLGIDDLVDRWVDIEIETKSGQKKTLQNAIFPLRDEDGEIQEIFGIVNDITDKVEAEERLELALEGTKAGIWDWNIQTGDLVVDERYAGIVGYKLEELEPVSFETWEELAHPEDLKRSNELLEKHFAGETDIYEFEGRMKHKDGHWVWVLDRGKVMEWDEDGDPVRMTGTHIDISEKKEYEEALRESERRYKNLFYKTPLGTIHYDDKGVITDCNERFVDIIGSSKEVLIGLNMLENLEDKELIKEVRRSLENGEGYYKGEYTSVTAGKTTPVRVLFKGMKDEDDDIYAGIGLVEDITERKKAEEEIKTSEERYRRLFETAQDGMLILDVETGEIKDANPYILELIGYSKKELVGKELWEIGTFRNIAENREKFQELVDEGYVRYEDLPLKTKSGGKIPVEFVSNTYMVSDKRVAQCNIRSIKDRHEREKELDLFYKILRYSQEEDTYIEDILEKTVQLVPESLLWPESAVCKIELDDREYKSDGFKKSEYGLANDIVVDGDIRGSIVVDYTEEKPEQDIGPFLNQEKALIQGVADILGMVIQKREAEERSGLHARLLNHIRSAVIYTDIDGKITYWNKGAEDLYGWEAEEVIGKNIVDITPSLMNKDQAEEIMRKLRQGNEWSGEFILKRKDGSEFEAWVVDSPVLDKNGELKGII